MTTVTAGAGAGPALRPLPRLGMARASWYVHRRELLGAFAVLAAAALALLISGLVIHAGPARQRPHLQGLLSGNGITVANNVTSWLTVLLFLPFVLGGFTGARLVGGDLDRGTVRFAWTQGVGRVRWAATSLLANGLLLGAAAAAVGLVFAWWDQPYAAWRLEDPAFGLYPPVFAAWTMASFAFAAFLGAAVRGLIAVINTTLAVTAITAFINASYLRYNVYPAALSGPSQLVPRGSFWTNRWIAYPDGRAVPDAALNRLHPPWDLPTRWLGQHHLVLWVTYQPPSRFWPLQLAEAGCLLLLALLFGGLAVWRVRRHSVWPALKGIV